MKKLIAIILLTAAVVFCLASCDGNKDAAAGVAAFKEMYKTSAPTKVLTNFTVSVGGVEFTGTSSLVTGVTTTGKRATVQIYEYENIQEIENGAGDVVLPVMGIPEASSIEYFEGKGVRYDGGGWDPEGFDFAPVPGSIALGISEKNIKDASYTVASSGIHTLIFTVPAAKVTEVFGQDFGIDSDVNVVITGNGAEVTGTTVTYSVKVPTDDEDLVYPTANITINTTYSYILEQVTLVK